MRSFLQKYWFILFPLISIIWYLPTYQYGFTNDFIIWYERYKQFDLLDLWKPIEGGGFRFLYHTINYGLVKILGASHVMWFILFALLHGLNANLVFRLVRNLKLRWLLDLKYLEWVVAFLFLVSPFQLESIVYKISIHYLLSLMCLLYGLKILVQILEQNKLVQSWKIHLLFFLSIFLLEANLIVPLIYLTFLVFDTLIGKQSRFGSAQTIVFLAPQFIITSAYLLVWKLKYSSLHFSGIQTDHLGKLWGYFAKHLAFVHMLNFDWKINIYKALSSPVIAFGILFAIVAVLIFYIWNKNNFDQRIRFSILGLVLSIIALCPMLGLEFQNVVPFINDRYAYLASPFIYMFAIPLVYFLSENWRHTIIILFVLINLIHSKNQIQHAHRAAQGMDYMIQNLPCERMDGKEVFLLGLPDNFNGLYFYRDYTDRAQVFEKSLDLFYPNHNCHTIAWHNPAQFNMQYVNDEIKAHFVNHHTIKVFIGQNGTWFWRKGKSMRSYENEFYRVEPKDWYYLLHLKKRHQNQVFFVSRGSEWKEVK